MTSKLDEYENVIHFCTNIVFRLEREKSAKILQYLVLNEVKYGSRQNSPHWNMLKNLVHIYESYYRDKQVCSKTSCKNSFKFFSPFGRMP